MESTKSLKTKSSTGVQISHGTIVGMSKRLTKPGQCGLPWSVKIREMRCDPCVSLFRNMFVTQVVLSKWSIQSTDDAPEGAADFILGELRKHQHRLMFQGAKAAWEWGWAPFEVIWEKREDGHYGINRFKQLVNECTDIKVTEDGRFNGYHQNRSSFMRNGRPSKTSEDIVLRQNAQHFAFDVEGDDHCGSSQLKAMERCFDQYVNVEECSYEFDLKMSGCIIELRFPYARDEHGHNPNLAVAKAICESIRSNGCAFFEDAGESIDDPRFKKGGNGSWSIKRHEPKAGAGDSFINKMRYLDSCKARALGFPERTALEGQMGTKAEAGEHGDIAVEMIDMRTKEMIASLNEQTVDTLLCVNYGDGARGSVYLVPDGMSQSTRECIKQAYFQILSRVDGAVDELDGKQMAETLGLPLLPEDEIDEEEDGPTLVEEGEGEGSFDLFEFSV